MPNTNKPELPRFNGHTSDVITNAGRETYVFVVTDAAPVQLIHPTQKFTRIGIENIDSNTGAIYIGGETVENESVALALAGKRGRKLASGDGRDEDTALAPWAIAEAGATCHVVCEFVI